MPTGGVEPSGLPSRGGARPGSRGVAGPGGGVVPGPGGGVMPGPGGGVVPGPGGGVGSDTGGLGAKPSNQKPPYSSPSQLMLWALSKSSPTNAAFLYSAVTT